MHKGERLLQGTHVRSHHIGPWSQFWCSDQHITDILYNWQYIISRTKSVLNLTVYTRYVYVTRPIYVTTIYPLMVITNYKCMYIHMHVKVKRFLRSVLKDSPFCCVCLYWHSESLYRNELLRFSTLMSSQIETMKTKVASTAWGFLQQLKGTPLWWNGTTQIKYVVKL